ncbi:hypothetical protein Q5P01_009067 [Channa striata]|uniref:Uncharacterized protein n=1 Tax=Channa striata TaxID=64152 RepID=A0AA88N7V2_CHASR|nr:hypothetical protein Q5P01_009067 [Channa striata]
MHAQRNLFYSLNVKLDKLRCAIRSECAPQVAGLMSTAGKRGWSVVSERNEIRTAAKEKISPEEPTVILRHMRGTIWRTTV